VRKHYVIGNWKMNLSSKSISKLMSEIEVVPDVVVGVAPSFPYLSQVCTQAGVSTMVGAQNVSEYDSGAYTGEVSSSMLSDLGVDFCLVGHSERRQLFAESNECVASKVIAVLQQKITAVLCCGETLDQYNSGSAKQVIKDQLLSVLTKLTSLDGVVVAYEPVWAIGTGLTATPEVAQDIHAFIRAELAEYFGDVAASKTSILYGGSVNAGNAAELFEQPDIDGALVGGAALKSAEFNKIIRAKS